MTASQAFGENLAMYKHSKCLISWRGYGGELLVIVSLNVGEGHISEPDSASDVIPPELRLSPTAVRFLQSGKTWAQEEIT